MKPNLRLLLAVLVLLGGAVHLKLSIDDYGTADIIKLFAVNAIASALVAAYLALREDAVGLLAAAGISAGTLVAFALSRVGDGILDFREQGLNPSPDAVATVVLELAALALAVSIFLRSGAADQLRVARSHRS